MGGVSVMAAAGVVGASDRPVVPAVVDDIASARVLAGQAFTGFTRISDGHQAALIEYLTALGKDIDGAVDIPFARLRTVHFMRWVVIPDREGGACLAFESNYDGELDAHLAELLQVGAVGMHKIYRHCSGYPLADSQEITPGDAAALIRFLRQGSPTTAAFHVGVHKKTAERIRREAQIRDEIEKLLDDRRAAGSLGALTPDEIHTQILEHLRQRDLLAWAVEKQSAPPASRNVPWIVRLAPVALLLLPVALPLYVWLRMRERTDPEDAPVSAPADIRKLADREDFQVQNQLTHVVDLKPGFLRRLTLRMVLWAVNLVALYKFNQGALGGISSIHFARWAFIDGAGRLLFFSNFDGSWESYLGDFVDKAHAGLTAVWSNTKGFPRTRNLVCDGATDEERFKSWSRTHQVPTQLWYSAYPQLTVLNIQQNARICLGLAEKPATPPAMLDWLERL